MNEANIVLLSSDSEASSIHECSAVNIDDNFTQLYQANEIKDKVVKNKHKENRLVHTLSDSDDSDNAPIIPSSTQFDSQSYKHVLSGSDDSNKSFKAESKHKEEKNTHISDTSYINSFKDQDDSGKTLQAPSVKRKGVRKTTKNDTKAKENKSQKKEEDARRKAERQAALKLQKQLKPGECMKYMKIIMDSALVNCNFGGELLASIQNMECEYQLSTNVISHSVTWLRQLPDSNPIEEPQMLLIWQWKQFVQSVREHTLCDDIRNIQQKMIAKIVTLVVCSLDGYFSYLKKMRRKSQRKKIQDDQGDDLRVVTRGEMELALSELQIQLNCSHRLVDTGQELGLLVYQFTKSISEIPFKKEKQKREQDKLDWFAVGDSRDCVRIDKEGNGLLRLWQQQLCQFNLAGIDTAQAIAAVYPSPQALIQAYDKCNTHKEGELLLQNIPVRRCQGPLASARRIGPELSKKIFTFFNNVDGDTPLSQE